MVEISSRESLQTALLIVIFVCTWNGHVDAQPCQMTGLWVMSNSHDIPSKDNMSITMEVGANQFDVSCDDAANHCMEGWKHANGTLSPSYNTSTWDKKVSITFPPHGRRKVPHTNTGTAEYSGSDCQNLRILWSDTTVWCKGLALGGLDCGPAPAPPTPPPSTNISNVYIVFSNHLDVGYTDNNNGSCAGSVVNRYFTQHFPNAIKTANYFRENNLSFAYKWMTQSWLVSVYRHCNETIINRFGEQASDITCPSAEDLTAFENAVKAGDITWHAFPHNAEPEMYDASLFMSSLNITFTEDDYYGHAHRMTLSQRDVPGLTRGAIPLLSKAGVRAVSVGENGACAPVNVPPIFLWRDNATDTDVIAMFHPHGYGSARRRRQTPSTLSDLFEEDGTEGLHYDSQNNLQTGPSDCVQVEAAGVAVCYAWEGDNKGPQTGEQALAIFKEVQQMYPKAKIHASDAFDDFVSAVLPYKSTLPVVTAEIGDTWIQGASSDPLKVAQFRAISRLRSECIEAGTCDPTTAEFKTFDRLLMKVGEHTWGWNGGGIRNSMYSNDELQKSIHDLKNTPYFQTAIYTWQEQRAFITNAIASLSPTNPLRVAIAAELAAITPTTAFDETGFVAVDESEVFSIGLKSSIGFDTSGAISHLVSPSGKEWAGVSNQIARIWYQGMDVDYFNDFSTTYNGHIAGNFAKPGLNLSAISSNMSLVKLQKKQGADSTVSFLLSMNIATLTAHTGRGAPATVEVLIDVREDGGVLNINYTMQWHNKTSCHAPETIWLSSVAKTQNPSGWLMDKLGSWLNPNDADLTHGDPTSCNPQGTTCGVHLHAIGKGVQYTGTDGKLNFESLDSALLSVGSSTPVPTPLTVPDSRGGMHWALVGNIWNTNYPFWYPFVDSDAASKYRFKMSFA
eukprot:m.138598 g.138598  ORF g.138598 m.138598 type:complete len:904 (+) comp30005_c0_seq1:320-3031(+)